jgi:protein-L-isoaspartate(D-aspartate) O-methyltransferase
MDRSRGARRALPLLAACATIGAAVLALGGPDGRPAMPDAPTTADDPYREARRRMVRDQIERRGVRDPRVLEAMRAVPRHLFVPESLRPRAYEDTPLPIGEGQTISQPYIVAFMTEALRPEPGDRVLEVGTGSGYQAAVLGSIVSQVYSIEILPALAATARARLQDLGWRNVRVRQGDGYRGWPEEAPFDGIMVTAAPGTVPQPLIDQLKEGGRLVIPVGTGEQQLVRLTRTATGIERETLLPVRFVPMTGEADRTTH